MWPFLQFYYSGYRGKLTLKPRMRGTVKNTLFMVKETKGEIKLKLGKKTYTLHYTFLPAQRAESTTPESFQPPSVEVNQITVRGRKLKEDEFIELTTKYKGFIQEEALKLEWRKRVDAITRILEGKRR